MFFKSAFLDKKAVAMLEYMVIIIFILGAFLVFKDYIIKGLMGRWRAVADTFGHGQQFDPRPLDTADLTTHGTVECFFEYNHCRASAWDIATLTCAVGGELRRWVDERCYRTHCNCDLPPEHPNYIGSDGSGGDPPYGCLLCLEFCSSGPCASM